MSFILCSVLKNAQQVHVFLDIQHKKLSPLIISSSSYPQYRFCFVSLKGTHHLIQVCLSYTKDTYTTYTSAKCLIITRNTITVYASACLVMRCQCCHKTKVRRSIRAQNEIKSGREILKKK